MIRAVLVGPFYICISKPEEHVWQDVKNVPQSMGLIWKYGTTQKSIMFASFTLLTYHNSKNTTNSTLLSLCPFCNVGVDKRKEITVFVRGSHTIYMAAFQWELQRHS